MTDSIKVLNEFLPKAETERLGAIKVGDTLDLDTNNVLNVNESAMASAYMTNCLISVPQDINLESLNGSLVLKAGSKIYIPNGFEQDNTTLHFDVQTLEADYTYHTDGNGQVICGINALSTIDQWRNVNLYSGTTAPTVTTDAMWYDRTNNIIKRYQSGDWITGKYSLPLAAVTFTSDLVSSIDQIFNGMTYIGEAAFVLPGIIALASDGKKADGNLINSKIIVDKVLVSTVGNQSGDHILAITPGGITQGRCYVVPTNTYTTALYPPSTKRWYNPNQNKYYIFNDLTTAWQNDPQAHIATIYKNNGDQITTFIPNTVFRSADYEEMHKELNELDMKKLDTSRIQYVSAVPGNPQDGVIYLIAQ